MGTVAESERDHRNEALVPSWSTVLLFCLLPFCLLNGCIKTAAADRELVGTCDTVIHLGGEPVEVYLRLLVQPMESPGTRLSDTGCSAFGL